MSKNKKHSRSLKTDTLTINRCFLIVFFLCAFFSMEIAILTRGRTLQDSLFWNGAYSDHFMDLINTVRDSHDLTWVYQRNVIYPPLSVLVTYALSIFIPKELAETAFVDRFALQKSSVVMLIFLVFFLIAVISITKMIDAYMSDNIGVFERVCVCIFTAVSFPVVYCLERGNLSMLALVGSMFFIFFRNSESKAVREISYIMLALSAGIKMFPAVLGVLLIYDKKYKAAVRTVIYGICAFILPYLLIKILTPSSGGLAEAVNSQLSAGEVLPGTVGEVNKDGSIGRLIENLISWFTKKTYFTLNSTSISNFVYAATTYLGYTGPLKNIVGMGSFIVTEIAAFILGFFCKREWQKVFVATYLMLNIHSISMHYTLIYLIPAFIVFLCEKNDEKTKSRKKTDWIYFVLFCLIIAPLPNFVFFNENAVQIFFALHFNTVVSCNFNKILSGIVFQLIFAGIILELIIGGIKRLKQAKKEKKEKAAAETAVNMNVEITA